jgi:hypothetical protein
MIVIPERWACSLPLILFFSLTIAAGENPGVGSIVIELAAGVVRTYRNTRGRGRIANYRPD